MNYVKRAETSIWKQKFNNWIVEIRKNVRKEGITFRYSLVGSSKRNLVIRHHNKGFDCDYQIILEKNRQKLSESDLKKLFMKEFDIVATKEGFDSCEDSSSAITIKLKDTAQSKIKVGYDVVILSKNEGKMQILKNIKEPGQYVFEDLPDFTDFQKRYSKINGADMWIELRERYYNKKINPDEKRKSIQILNEAVNETLNQIDI